MTEGGFEQQPLCEHGNPIEQCKICIQNPADEPESVNETREPSIKTQETEQPIPEESSEPSETKYWQSATNIAEELGTSRATIVIAAERYRELHPDWFVWGVWKGRGNRGDRFSPELVEKIRDDIRNREKPPAGWMTASGLAKFLNINSVTISRILEKYREQSPDSFRVYWATNNRKEEHVSPEIIQILKNEIDEKAPVGWLAKGALAKTLKVDFATVQGIVDPLREQHPEWFRLFRGTSHGVRELAEYFSPELVSKVLETALLVAPEGWRSPADIANEMGKDYLSTRARLRELAGDSPEHIGRYRAHDKWIVSEYFSPAVIQKLQESMPADPPEGWMIANGIAPLVGVSRPTINAMTKEMQALFPGGVGRFRSKGGGPSPIYFRPDVVEYMKQQIKERAPNGWLSAGELSEKAGIARNTLGDLVEPHRNEHPEWFKFYRVLSGHTAEHYSPELSRLTVESIQRAPEGWHSAGELESELGRSHGWVNTIISDFREQHPEWFQFYYHATGKKLEYYSPKLCDYIREFQERRPPENWISIRELASRMGLPLPTLYSAYGPYKAEHPEFFQEYSKEGGKGHRQLFLSPEVVLYLDSLFVRPPSGWKTMRTIAEEFEVTNAVVGGIVKRYQHTHPEWFYKYRTSGGFQYYLAPEVVEVVKNILGSRESRSRLGSLEATLEQYSKEIAEGSIVPVSEFKTLLGLFGSSHAADLLYRLHPSFKSIPADRVSGMLAQYLGDFLLLKSALDLEGLRQIKNLGDFLTDEDLREGLLEVVKNGCLTHYQEQRRINPHQDAQQIIGAYFTSLRDQVASLQNERLNAVIDDAEGYYHAVYFEQEKPNQLVSQLREGRVFPDINQRINMKEIADKRRMLIADEMGLGKSASAILSKEYLGARCALIVAPSNVIATWGLYLSDSVDAEGKQIGYFQPGEAPRVLTIKNIEDLEGVDGSSYDYILISQERLNDRHMNVLKDLDYDMLIVDEIHKLKNVMGGKRSQHILDLAKRIEGENEYLVMLSGTPVPNKVGDVALLLKMLYPEKFEQIEDEDLVKSIIYGDVVEMRNLLVPRMQLKRLQESLDMPPLGESNVSVELSSGEEEIYNVLLEEDELTASEKIAALRKFLLNPELLQVAPELPGAKAEALNHELHEAFRQHESVIVYVNGYVEDVIRGDHAMLRKIDLPEDVAISLIDGSTPQAERQRIQQRIQTGGGKLLVVVSGQTADVGVDFSQADHVIFYNEPWTEYDKEQQLGRVYREGHQTALESRTLITSKTIEDGIHQYIGAKQKAIEKLLRGIPRTEMENRLLEQDEQRPDENLEVNPELAEYYFSAWDRMLRIFGHVREMGEADFKRFLDLHGEEYANCYSELGSRTYQANNSRVVASMLSEMVQEKHRDVKDLRMLDIASGPEMLKKHLPESLQDSVVSLDINEHHFARGPSGKVVGSFSHLPFRDGSMDYCNLALSLHYTKFLPRRAEYERVEVLTEMNRVLKVGGRGTISLLYNINFKDPPSRDRLVEELGFRIIDKYSGDASNGDKYRAHILTLEKVQDIPEMQSSEQGIEVLTERIDRKVLDGLKFKRQKGLRLKNSRRVLDQATLTTKHGERKIAMSLNENDRRVFHDEQAVLGEGRSLIKKYQGIERVPIEELKTRHFSRILAGKKFILFKKLENDEGAVIVRDR